MARLRVTQWNAERILARSAQILEDFGPQVAFQAEQELAKDQYWWPAATLRKSGQFVPEGDRDIIDTGFLLNSATPPVVSRRAGGSAQLRIEWTAPYARAVQIGGYVVGSGFNNYVAPGRDWIANTYAQLRPGKERPFLPYLVRRWQQLAEGGRGRGGA